MSTHADVTVVLTEPDKQCCSFKYNSNLPVGIYKDKHYRSKEPNWFIAEPGYYLRFCDAMILIWYDGISCFIQVNGGFTAKIGDNIHNTKHKINIRHGDIIRIRDSWKEMEKEICLKFEIFCDGNPMNVDQSNNFSDSREQTLAHKRAPQNQIPTFQPSPNSGQWSELTSTAQKLDLRNPRVKSTPLENLRLQSDTVKCIPPGQVAKMKNVYEPNGPVESRKVQNMPVRKTKASPKYRISLKSKKDLRFPCSSEQYHDYMQQEKNKITNLTSNVSGNEMRDYYGVTNHRNTSKGVKSHASQSDSLSYSSNVSGNEIKDYYGVTNHRNTQKVENITANQNVLLPLASHRDTCDDDMPDKYCVMDQSNTQQEGQIESDETIIIPNHCGNCDSIVYTQEHSEEKPMEGVSNMGMTCYANGIFQILAQTQLFLSAMKPGEDMLYKPLTYSLYKVLKEINHKSENREFVRELLDVIAKDSCFSSCRQDDCFEFLMHILERLKAENQQSTSMFEMHFQTVIEHNAHSVPHVDVCDTQLSFHLLIPFYQEPKNDNPKVESCLNKMLNTVESFSGKELPCRFCPGTEASRHRVSKHFVVSTAPDILILQIGRVEHTKYLTYSDLKKRNELVEYEHILHIDEVHWDSGTRTTKRNNYQLYGVVLHAGNIECGHYYCFVKHRNTSEWFDCNDLVVRPKKAGMVLNDPNAYLLFYQKFENTMSYK